MMKSNLKIFIISVSALVILACALFQVTPTPPPPIPSTAILPPTAPLATPFPTPISSDPASNERWMLYEDALAARLLSIPISRGDGYCEWQILEQEGLEVFVWAICQLAGDPSGTTTSAPVVITLSGDGLITGVEMPRDGSLWGDDVRAMFPEDLWSAIFFETADIDGMWAHIQSRHVNPEPPLIALSGILLP